MSFTLPVLTMRLLPVLKFLHFSAERLCLEKSYSTCIYKDNHVIPSSEKWDRDARPGPDPIELNLP